MMGGRDANEILRSQGRDTLRDLLDGARPFQPLDDDEPPPAWSPDEYCVNGASPLAEFESKIVASPFAWRDPATIPRRAWLYRRHYIRGHLTATVAPGGVGKTSLALAEAIAMATGRDIFSEAPISAPLRVWYWNGEDPRDEIERRIAAICQHHGIDAERELMGRLFFDSGHDVPIKLASAAGANVKFNEADIAAVEEQIRRHRIDVVILDPFVSIHTVPENDNVAIDQVVKRIAHIADATNCAIEIAHHVRKPAQGQAELTVDDARGGGAIVNAARSVRVLNRMSATEAEHAGINATDRRFYFRADLGKANMAPPEAATWSRLVGVPLPNGDNVAAVEAWKFPDAFAGVTSADRDHIRDLARAGDYRADSRSPKWIGHAVADRLGLDAKDKSHRAKIKHILVTWFKNKVLDTEDRSDGKTGHVRKFVVTGNSTEPTVENDPAPVV